MDIKMRRKIHRFCGIALSACLLLGACITPALTGDAADKLSGNVAEETTATRNEKVSRNDLEPASETDLLSEETGDKTGGLTGQEEAESTPKDGKTTPETETKDDPVVNEGETDDNETVEDEDITKASEEETEPEELKENSFRYQNGELISEPQALSRASYPYAWQKVNGKYMNSIGQVIEGATKKGIDVSHHQGVIDWEKVKKDGIDFAIIRCGYGGDYQSYDDRYWVRNVTECERLGIPYGVYLYSYSENIEDAKSEAAHALRLLKGHKPAYGIYYDLEDENTTGRVSNTTIGTIAKTFCDQLSSAGYKVGIYASKYWWTERLTSSVFKNEKWSKWVAQYNTSCTYEGSYDIWQCTSTGSVAGINGAVDLNFWMGDPQNSNTSTSIDRNIISSTGHVQADGWTASVQNGDQIGVTGQSKRLEAFQIKIGNGYGDLGIRYASFVEDQGWQAYVTSGKTSGTTGESKAVQAVKIQLTGSKASNYDVYYRAHVQTYGWLGWTKNGAAAGTTGYEKRMEALQVMILPKGAAAPGALSNAYKEKALTKGIGYEAHMQTYCWLGEVANGATGGITGQSKRMEALQINLKYPQYSGDVSYRAYVQNTGWQGWVKNGATAGTTGKNLQMEAVQIKLTGKMAEKYDIYYRVHTQTYGWLGWTKNGASAGTNGYNKRIEGIQIRLVAKGGAAPGSTSGAYKDRSKTTNVVYQAHMQTYCWLDEVMNGATGGVTGQYKRMEALKISLENKKYSGGIQYRAHLQTTGWQGWKSNGEMAGTTGQSRQMEAIQIKLTGKMAEKYDIYYRAHVQTYGWLGWTKNGAKAGTEGLSKRMEGIQIQLVPKGGAAPGSTSSSFKEKAKPQNIVYQAHMQTYCWLGEVMNGATGGVTGQYKRMEALKIKIQNPKYSGGVQYRAHLQTTGWQGWKSNGEMAGTTGQYRRMEAVQIKLTGKMAEKYDIYYRAHVQTYGWLGWTKNGAKAGTEGMSKRMEGIQIQLVEKGKPGPSSGQTAFRTK